MAKSKDAKQPSAVSGQPSATTKSAPSVVEAVKSPRVTAGTCEKSERHTNTRVYSTKGSTRFCVCDDCGHTWKKTGERADADKQYLAELAESLNAAVAVTKDGEEFILIETKVRKQIVAKLRDIAGK